MPATDHTISTGLTATIHITPMAITDSRAITPPPRVVICPELRRTMAINMSITSANTPATQERNDAETAAGNSSVTISLSNYLIGFYHY